MALRHDMGHSVKRTVEIGFVVPFSAGKIFIARKYCKSNYFQLLLSKTLTLYLALLILTFVNFKPIISPVNRDFLFDEVNPIVEPL